MMIQLIIGILFFIGLYILTNDEAKWLKIVSFAYYSILSIIFIIGYNQRLAFIEQSETIIKVAENPLFSWVTVFGYLFSIPFMLISFYILLRIVLQIKNQLKKVLISGLFLFIILTVGHFMNLLFILLFYGTTS
ncbi:MULTISPECIES: hypothetical protein [Oceanobacillus]|uniref:DUF4064 domain-containing protein n=1 Tax=Oceanobacillus kimchii TaxID=746691 RepID=A0ABQ5TKX6_9BACI|nr:MULTISPECIES: hypothetical protein [Oceanobacillus]MCT1579132.1 hypothetical protein [Oceanobacillus kimchii]MCT2137340.1 hypothetical protein [Oceanobacillus kimchii]OEH54068.1 hypothetical protein AQ616_09795 [Oceanobacillus sp. E9]GLO66976.1 hypothetical protein MACH08_27600 [Oceanobacillus kimchii]